MRTPRINIIAAEKAACGIMRFRDKNLRIAYMPELVRGVYKAGAVFTKRARHSQSGRGVYKAGAAFTKRARPTKFLE